MFRAALTPPPARAGRAPGGAPPPQAIGAPGFNPLAAWGAPAPIPAVGAAAPAPAPMAAGLIPAPARAGLARGAAPPPAARWPSAAPQPMMPHTDRYGLGIRPYITDNFRAFQNATGYEAPLNSFNNLEQFRESLAPEFRGLATQQLMQDANALHRYNTAAARFPVMQQGGGAHSPNRRPGEYDPYNMGDSIGAPNGGAYNGDRYSEPTIPGLTAPHIQPQRGSRSEPTLINRSSPEQVEANRAANLNRMASLSTMEGTVYPYRERFSPEHPLERSARDLTSETRQQFEPGYADVARLTGEAQQSYPEAAERYMNPYIRQVIDEMSERAARDRDAIERKLGARAISMGKGGSRGLSTTKAITKAITEQKEDLVNAQHKFLADQYNRNADIFSSDMARRLEAARGVGQLTQARLQGHLADINGRQQAGEAYRALGDRNRAFLFGERRRRELLPMELAGMASNALAGANFTTSSIAHPVTEAPGWSRRNTQNALISTLAPMFFGGQGGAGGGIGSLLGRVLSR